MPNVYEGNSIFLALVAGMEIVYENWLKPVERFEAGGNGWLIYGFPNCRRR